MTEEALGPVTVGPVAHGGHCVARLDGRVLFVRHALPGEVVRVRITDTRHERFWLADAVEVLTASPDRVPPPCPIFRPGGCGGCDFQHATGPAQRALKGAVVAEQLKRLAGLDWVGEVEGVHPEFDWRTRMRYLVERDGTLAMRVHHSNEAIALPAGGCRIADPGTRLPLRLHPGEALVVAAESGPVVLQPGDDVPEVTERAAGRQWRVAADGFWQVHPAAADTLVAAVLAGLQPRPREHAFDLFCGVGLFAGALVDAGCTVSGIEGDKAAVELARRNVPQASIVVGDVTRRLRQLPIHADLVVLDPPRTGAGRVLMAQLCGKGARAIAYVACDPAALARDLGSALQLGYHLSSLRAFDLFPQTHHVECVAILEPA